MCNFFLFQVTSATTSFVMKILRAFGSKHFLTQIQEIGFLIHWESLLSTQGDEMGMLEDFITAIHDLNSLKFKVRERETERQRETEKEEGRDKRERVGRVRFKF